MSNPDSPCAIHIAECLRPPELAHEPDPRTVLTLTQHHADIAAIKLNSLVPEPVAIQFETARNLYLYAWHVYRFYMAAEMQAYATLELGLRQRLPERLPPQYQNPKTEKAMLFGLLSYAIDQGYVRNDGFRRWHEAAKRRAEHRHRMELIQSMTEGQVQEMGIDDSVPIVVMQEDQSWDLLAILREGLHKDRNRLAHGSTELTRQVIGTIEIVAEILNQLYVE